MVKHGIFRSQFLCFEITDEGLLKVFYFMSLCGIGLTPSPLGENFSIVQGCTEKGRIAHTI